jgi:hypothetical protein
MAKTLPSDATRVIHCVLAAPGMSAAYRQFRAGQLKLERLLELRAEIEALRSGRVSAPRRGAANTHGI